MPRRCAQFISGFLIPNLNAEKFGERLKWVNKQKGIFQLQWNHKSASYWSVDDVAVFVEWDRQKGRYGPNDKEFYTKSKQRFRSLLNKLVRVKQVKELNPTDKNMKIFQFVKKGDCLPEVAHMALSETNDPVKKGDCVPEVAHMALSETNDPGETYEHGQDLLMHSEVKACKNNETHHDHIYANLADLSKNLEESTIFNSELFNKDYSVPTMYILVEEEKDVILHRIYPLKKSLQIPEVSPGVDLHVNILRDVADYIETDYIEQQENSKETSDLYIQSDDVQGQNYNNKTIEVERINLNFLEDNIPLNYSVSTYGPNKFGDAGSFAEDGFQEKYFQDRNI